MSTHIKMGLHKGPATYHTIPVTKDQDQESLLVTESDPGPNTKPILKIATTRPHTNSYHTWDAPPFEDKHLVEVCYTFGFACQTPCSRLKESIC